MKEHQEKTITLYLAGWQQRMLGDYMDLSERKSMMKKLIIKLEDRRQWVMYRVLDTEIVHDGGFNLYLTDEQISHIAEVAGVDLKVSALTISPKMLEAGVIIPG